MGMGGAVGNGGLLGTLFLTHDSMLRLSSRRITHPLTMTAKIFCGNAGEAAPGPASIGRVGRDPVGARPMRCSDLPQSEIGAADGHGGQRQVAQRPQGCCACRAGPRRSAGEGDAPGERLSLQAAPAAGWVLPPRLGCANLLINRNKIGLPGAGGGLGR